MSDDEYSYEPEVIALLGEDGYSTRENRIFVGMNDKSHVLYDGDAKVLVNMMVVSKRMSKQVGTAEANICDRFITKLIAKRIDLVQLDVFKMVREDWNLLASFMQKIESYVLMYDLSHPVDEDYSFYSNLIKQWLENYYEVPQPEKLIVTVKQ